MTLTTKFKKDLSTLRAAVDKEIFLDVKHPKLYKKICRYYQNEVEFCSIMHEKFYEISTQNIIIGSSNNFY